MREPRSSKVVAFPGTQIPAEMPIRIEGLVLTRERAPLIDGLSMTLSPRGISAVMGPNGAGKSVLLRVIAGLLRANSGTVTLPAPMRGRVGFVFQRPILLRRSVRGNLSHALRVARCDRALRSERLVELLAMAGLTDHADRPARKLSGGQAQRLAIVRALAASPSLLLADEPTAHLDPQAMFAVETLLARIALTGTKIVLVSHDNGQISRLASEVAFLHQGRCYEVTNTEQFFAAAKSPEAQAYLEGTLLL